MNSYNGINVRSTVTIKCASCGKVVDYTVIHTETTPTVKGNVSRMFYRSACKDEMMPFCGKNKDEHWCIDCFIEKSEATVGQVVLRIIDPIIKYLTGGIIPNGQAYATTCAERLVLKELRKSEDFDPSAKIKTVEEYHDLVRLVTRTITTVPLK